MKSADDSKRFSLAELTVVVLLLLGTTAAYSAERVPPVFLSHFFVVLDPGTFAALIAVGPDFTLEVVRARARTGIQQVDVRLRRDSSDKNIKLGNAHLILRGRSGSLIFWPDS